MSSAANNTAKTISFARIRAVKAADRKQDHRRLAHKQVTPEQLQAENALFNHCNEFRIINLAESFQYFRRHAHHSLKR